MEVETSFLFIAEMCGGCDLSKIDVRNLSILKIKTSKSMEHTVLSRCG